MTMSRSACSSLWFLLTHEMTDLLKDNWSAERYHSNANFVYSHAATQAVVSLLDPKPGVRSGLSAHSGSLTVVKANIRF